MRRRSAPITFRSGLWETSNHISSRFRHMQRRKSRVGCAGVVPANHGAECAEGATALGPFRWCRK
jgi:hypothetical protein